MTFEELKNEFKLVSDRVDRWSEAMSLWFDICSEIYENRMVDIPHEWEFKPGAMGATPDPDSYWAGLLEDVSDEDLLRMGHLLNRYTSLLMANGKGY